MVQWICLFIYSKIIFNESAFKLIFSSFLAQKLFSCQALPYRVNEIEKGSVSDGTDMFYGF